MFLIKLCILEILIVLSVRGMPLEEGKNSCKGFWWAIMGSQDSGEKCNQGLEAVEESHDKLGNHRLSKREEFGGLGAIGNLMNVVNSNINLNKKYDSVTSCKACKTGLQMIKVFTHLTNSTEHLISIGIKLCSQIKIMTDDICDGLMRINGPPIIHILKTTNMAPLDICSFIMKSHCTDRRNPDHLWHVDVPQVSQTNEVEKEGRSITINENSPTLKVLHISDTHYDPYYKEGTWAECSLPLCCRDEIGEASENSTTSGHWGGWKCDIPERTLDNLLDHINKQHPDIDYIIWTGDVPPHDSWSFFKNDSLDILNKTVNKMLQHFPNIPIYPALGNHEAVPINMYPPSSISGNEWSVDWLFEKVGEEWNRWLGENATQTVRQGGFYTVLVRQGLRIVSLNTNYCYYHNWWLVLNSTDPNEELKWLVEVLENAEKNDEKVHIIGHIPVGHGDCLKMWQENYYSIIKRFKSTVAAQFFGHTHSDEFELFYDDKDLDHPIGVAYLGPSVTTYSYLNPGYRIYYIDGDHDKTTRLVTDHETWIMDLDDANLNGVPVWYKLYSAREAYKMPSLTPQDWHEFFQKMYKNEDLLALYYKHFWKDSPKRPECNQECRKNLYCQIRSCDQYGQPMLPV